MRMGDILGLLWLTLCPEILLSSVLVVVLEELLWFTIYLGHGHGTGAMDCQRHAAAAAMLKNN
jgi:hypothetical protein